MSFVSEYRIQRNRVDDLDCVWWSNILLDVDDDGLSD